MANRYEKENAQLRILVSEQAKTIARLNARLRELEAALGQNSSNSGKPPSADPPEAREQRPNRPATGRKPGGQAGHKGRLRELLPAERVDRTVDHYPTQCLDCGRRLAKEQDAAPIRHQVVELPVIKPEVTEHRLHRIACPCGRVTCARLPLGVPSGMCGPRLMAFIALLTGFFHVSRRQAHLLLSDVLGIAISIGAISRVEERVSNAIATPVQQVHDHVLRQKAKHVDATTWRERGEHRVLWTIATNSATVFQIVADGARATLQKFLKKVRGVLITDRGTQFGFWAMDRRQICWAHLLRKFVAFSEHSEPTAAALGDSLLLLTQSVFHEWHRIRDGTSSRADFHRHSLALRVYIETWLERGVALEIRGVSGSCADILAHRAALWTFADECGVEPTNNEAERELRGFVLWRKRCFGSQSERGNRFAERIMTVTHTLRKQKRHVLSFLTEACSAALEDRPAPSLIT